jgi:hypothetical protein
MTHEGAWKLAGKRLGLHNPFLALACLGCYPLSGRRSVPLNEAIPNSTEPMRAMCSRLQENRMTLSKYAKRLAAAVDAEDEAALERLCVDLEYEQRGRDYWPSEVFEFFTDALRDPRICALKGSLNFITSLHSDFRKFTPEQRTALMQVLDDNADGFGDSMLRHAAGDVLARLYPVPVALGMFKAWVRGATPNRLHMAQVGLEVLILTKRLDAVGEAKVRSDLQVLSQPSI